MSSGLAIPSNVTSVFSPDGWQVDPLHDKSPILLLTGSAGGGKSRLAAEKLHAYCLHYPRSTALMLRKIRETTKNSIVLFMERTVMGRDNMSVRHLSTYSRFEYSNGSILAYGGMKDEEQREAIRSIGQDGSLDIAWMEEAIQFAEEDLNELLPRMRGKAAPWRQIILSTNPDADTHWIYRRLIRGKEAAVYVSSAADNSYNPDDYLDTLNRVTGIQRERLVLGRWVLAEGAVYDEYDADTHLKDQSPHMRSIRYCVAGVDWGYTNPGVINVWGIDGDKRMHLMAEVYQTQRSIAWWVEAAKQLKDTWDIEWFAADPSEPAYIADFKKARLRTYPADNALRNGISKVKDRLIIQDDGRPRLYLYRNAIGVADSDLEIKKKPTSIIDEISAYVWPKSRDGRAVKEVPVDDNNHAMDAMRYVVMRLDGKRGVRFG